MITFIIVLVSVFVGGYGGFQYGASVERKAQSELAVLRATAVATEQKVVQEVHKL